MRYSREYTNYTYMPVLYRYLAFDCIVNVSPTSWNSMIEF